MKKVMWIIAILALVLTAVVLPFLPETVPLHFDAYWNADRWGSRLELLLLPGLLLVLALCWQAVLNAMEKKAAAAEEEKQRVSALTIRKASGIAGVSIGVVLLLLQAWLLYLAHRGGETASAVSIGRLPLILVGLLFIVLGNIMPKTRRNSFIGYRSAKSRYNDDTWRRTNRFGGYVLVVLGILTVLAAALIPSSLMATIVMLVFLAIALGVMMFYAGRVYAQEKERSEKTEE